MVPDGGLDVTGGGPDERGAVAPRKRRSPRARAGRVLAAVCTALILLILFALPMLDTQPTVKVGLLVPISGNYSYLVDVRDGMLLAVEEINRWGGVNGAEIEVLVRDTQSDPEVAVEAFNELERDEEPLFYVSTVSHLTLPLVPLAEEAEVVLMGVVTAAQNLIGDNDWTVRFSSDAMDEAEATMCTMDELDVTDLGILYSTDEFSVSLEGLLHEGCVAAGCAVDSHQVGSDCSNLDDCVSMVMDRQAVFLGMIATQIRETILTLRACNYSGHILCASGATSDVVRPMPEAEGVYVAAPAMYNDNYLPVKWVSQAFEERYGRNLTHYATCGYDVPYLFSGLMRDVEFTRENLHDALEGGFMFSGTTGPLQVDPGVHDIGFDLLSARISEGRLWYL